MQSQKFFYFPLHTSPLYRFLPYAPDAYAKDSFFAVLFGITPMNKGRELLMCPKSA